MVDISKISNGTTTYDIKDAEARNSIASLANVAISGDYDDLLNKPTIPAAQIQSDWNATSTSSKAYILNKPTIPTTVAELSDASNYVTTNNIINVNTVALANVAISGDYNDLVNKPTIPVVDQTYNASSTNAQSGVAVASALSTLDSTVVHKTGDETIGGSKTFTGTQKLNGNTLKCFSFAKGTNPSSTQYANIYLTDNTGTNGDNTALGRFRTQVNSEGLVSTYMTSFKNATGNTNSSIGIHYPATGDPYTSAPTPATSDNSTKIATTAFVKAQGYTTNIGTITEIKMNGTSMGTSGVVDLGTVITSHQSLSNYVTLNGTQTISGAKTFTANQNITKAKPVLQLKDTSITRGTAPSAAVNSITINGLDSAGKNTWGIYHTWGTDKSAKTQLICYKGTTTDNAWGGIGVGYDASGNVFTSAPTPATTDNSTKIATTAWVKNQGYAVDSGLVHTTGSETIGGTKTFTESYNVKNDAVKGTAPKADKVRQLQFCDKNGSIIGTVFNTYATDKKNTVGFSVNKANSASDTDRAFLFAVYPASGNPYTYCPASDVNGSIVTTVNKSKAQSGYFQLGNGLIIQWGYSNKFGSSQTVTFPKAFTTTNYAVTISRNSHEWAEGVIMQTDSYTKTTFNFTVNDPGCHWIAIGY